MMSRAFPALALALAALFFGIALYINLAEQPARLALPDMPLLEQWKISFGVGFALQGQPQLLLLLQVLLRGGFIATGAG